MSAEPIVNLGADTSAVSRKAAGWVAFLQVLAIVAGASALLWPSTASLLEEWQDTNNQTYTHGWLILAVSIFLLFRSREALAARVTVPSLGAAIALAAMSVLWLVPLHAGIELGHQVLFPAILLMSVYALLGRRAAGVCAFPFAYLVFAIPVWSLFNGVLQDFTVHAVKLMVHVASIQAYVEGNFVQIASGTFEIAGGCSGLHFFIVAAAIGALNGELNRDTYRIRAITLFIAVLLALVSNWVRVFTIIVAGYLTDMQHYLIQVDHYKFGWLVFAVAMVAFFLIVRRLPPAPVPEQPKSLPPIFAGASKQRAALTFAAVLAAIGVGPAWGALQSSTPARSASEAPLLPPSVGSWNQAEPATTTWAPVFRGADVSDVARYRSGPNDIQLYTAVYFTQRQGKELIGYVNSVASTDEVIVRSGTIDADAGRYRFSVVRDGAGKQSVVVYFYQVDGYRVAKPVLAQLTYGIRSLFGQPIAGVVAARGACSSNCEETIGELSDALDAVDSGALMSGA